MDRMALHANLLNYTDVRRRLMTLAIVVSDVPIEAAISLPMPTMRWIRPGYGVFAAPAVRLPGRSPIQGPPDRWWMLDAHGGRLALYALTDVVPFAPGIVFPDVVLSENKRSIEEQRDDLAVLDRLLDGLVPSFFAGEAGAVNQRRAASETLSLVIPSELVARYRAFAPDFFEWLEA